MIYQKDLRQPVNQEAFYHYVYFLPFRGYIHFLGFFIEPVYFFLRYHSFERECYDSNADKVNRKSGEGESISQPLH